jgi:hypothetical protein
MSLIKSRIVYQDKLVGCLPGYECLDTKEIAKRRPRFFVRKSSEELKLEKELKRLKLNHAKSTYVPDVM